MQQYNAKLSESVDEEVPCISDHRNSIKKILGCGIYITALPHFYFPQYLDFHFMILPFEILKGRQQDL